MKTIIIIIIKISIIVSEMNDSRNINTAQTAANLLSSDAAQVDIYRDLILRHLIQDISSTCNKLNLPTGLPALWKYISQHKVKHFRSESMESSWLCEMDWRNVGTFLSKLLNLNKIVLKLHYKVLYFHYKDRFLEWNVNILYSLKAICLNLFQVTTSAAHADLIGVY